MDDARQPDTPRSRGGYDAPHLSPGTPAEDARTIMLNRVSWGAVLAGVVVAPVMQLVLNLLGISLGTATLELAAGAADNPSASSFSIGAEPASGMSSPGYWPHSPAVTWPEPEECRNDFTTTG
jgi:hypothetical protein